MVVSRTAAGCANDNERTVGNRRPPIDQNVADTYMGAYASCPPQHPRRYEIGLYTTRHENYAEGGNTTGFKMHRDHVRLSPLAAPYSPASVSVTN